MVVKSLKVVLCCLVLIASMASILVLPYVYAGAWHIDVDVLRRVGFGKLTSSKNCQCVGIWPGAEYAVKVYADADVEKPFVILAIHSPCVDCKLGDREKHLDKELVFTLVFLDRVVRVRPRAENMSICILGISEHDQWFFEIYLVSKPPMIPQQLPHVVRLFMR